MRAHPFWTLMVAFAIAGCGDNFDLFTGGAGGTTTSAGGGSGGDTSGTGASAGSGGNSGGNGGNAGGSGGNSGGSGGSGGSVSPLCGNSDVDYALGEECDDGNTMAGDGCGASCKIEAAPTCGNGALDLAAGEECDDGNTTAGDGCSATCQIELVGQLCGDDAQQSPEVCDDGNLANGDGCNPTCNLKGATSLFAGAPGQGGTTDGTGAAARFSGAAVLAANATHLFVGQEGSPLVGPRLRRVNIATALVETIAGSGAPGYTDDANGLNAAFGSLEALATDGTTIWVADGANSYIRAVSATAPHGVTTVVGSGVPGYADGNGAAVQFQGIRGLTYYNGEVYFLDPTAATLRRLNPATGDVITLAGSPGITGKVDGFGMNARFISPRYMVSDGSGMLYIADTNGNQIRAYNTVTTEVTTFAGGGACGYVDGAGAAALVHRPRGMASDGTSIYWVEFNAHTVRQGVVATKSVSTLAGTIAGSPCLADCSCANAPMGGYAEGTGTAAQLRGPFSVVFHYPTSSLFVMDSGNFVLRRIQ